MGFGVDGQAQVVFVAYAREDVAIRERLEVVLKPLVRQGRLEVWVDNQIDVGRRWNDEIERTLQRAELAVLLISADFLASDFIMQVELPRLVERGVPLICVPVGACAWRDHDELMAVQWPLSPERSLAAMDRNERDQALVAVYEAVKALAETIAAPEAVPRTRIRSGQSATPLSATSAVARLIGVPPLPAAYVPRPGDLDALKAQLRVSDGVGVVGQRQATGLHGQGGIGKSVLATAVCRDPEVRSWFPDGILWATIGEAPDLVAVQREVASQLGDDVSFSTVLDGRTHLCRLLADRRCLVVVDDVWSTGAAEAMAVSGPGGRLLYTTRDPAILADIGAEIHGVDVLDTSQSLAFLVHAGRPVNDNDRAVVERAVAHTGGVLLALSLLAGAARTTRWDHLAGEFEGLGEVFRDHPYADVFKAMRVAVDRLPAVDAHRYRILGVFPEDVPVPAVTVARLWGVDQAEHALRGLAEAGLLTWADGRVRFHDLQRAFILFDSTQPAALVHQQLLDAHRPAQGWAYLADDEPYLWNHLFYHLERAGQRHEMADVATNGRWLARRVHRVGAYPAEADVAHALDAQPENDRVATVLAMLRRWPALFMANLSLAGAAATIVSRWPAAHDEAATVIGPVWFQPGWPLPEPSGALLRTLRTGPIAAVVFAPDGRTLATAATDGTVGLWDPVRGTRRATFTGHTGPVTSVAFAPDGAILATAGDDRTVRLWDPATGAHQATLAGHTKTVRSVAFAPDGATLATGGDDRTVRLWDPATGAHQATLAGHTKTVRSVAFAPDGATLATGGDDRTVRLWDPATGAHRATLTGHPGWVMAVVFAPDGATLATAATDGTVRLWDLATGTHHTTLTGHTSTVRSVAFAPDGGTLATAATDGTVRLWDPAAGTHEATLTGHTRTVRSVVFAPDGATLATASDDCTVRLWDPATDTHQTTSTGHTGLVRSVAFAPDGGTLASGSDDGTVRLWDPATGAHQATLTGHTGPIRTVAFAPDGGTLASGSTDGTVRLWDPATGTHQATLTGHTGPIRTVAFAPDGATLASGSTDGTVRLWDPATGAHQATLTGHAAPIKTVAFAPDGATLASGSTDGTVRLWDPATGTHQATLTGHSAAMRAVGFAPDGGTLATASDDGTVRLWDPATGTHQATLIGHTKLVTVVAFAPDGATLATGSDDGTVRLWDPAANNELAALRLGASVADVAWAPTGDTLSVGFGTNVTILRLVDSR